MSTSSMSKTTSCATASATPDATPACAGPHVMRAWPSDAMRALLTNNVNGFTGNPGWSTTTNGAWPSVGVANAVAQAVPTGPSRGPSTVLTCAAFAPSPTNDSPSCKWLRSSIPDLLQQLRRHRVRVRVVVEQPDVPRPLALHRRDTVQRVASLEEHER